MLYYKYKADKLNERGIYYVKRKNETVWGLYFRGSLWNPEYKVEQFLKLDYEFYNNPRYNNYCRLEPINKGKKWNMFGGAYLCSSDSRFQLFVGGCKYPVPIHDRYES